MNLQTLLAPLQNVKTHVSSQIELSGIAYDSRKVQKGDLFVALPGEHVQGSEFLDQAAQAGAVAALTDREISTSLPLFVVPDTRYALAVISNIFYEHPSSRLKLYGVTG